MSRDNLRRVFYLIGMIGIFVAGLAFVMLCDMLIKTVSTWLFVAMLFSLGSGVCCVLSGTFKDKRKAEIVLKSVAVGLTALYLGFLLFYRFGPLSVFETNKDKGLSLIVTIICLVVSVAAIVGQVGDLVLTVLNKDEIVDEQSIIDNIELSKADSADVAADEVVNESSAENDASQADQNDVADAQE